MQPIVRPQTIQLDILLIRKQVLCTERNGNMVNLKIACSMTALCTKPIVKIQILLQHQWTKNPLKPVFLKLMAIKNIWV